MGLKFLCNKNAWHIFALLSTRWLDLDKGQGFYLPEPEVHVRSAVRACEVEQNGSEGTEVIMKCLWQCLMYFMNRLQLLIAYFSNIPCHEL